MGDKRNMSIVIVDKSRFIDPQLHRSISRLYRKGDNIFGRRRCKICDQWITWMIRIPEQWTMLNDVDLMRAMRRGIKRYESDTCVGKTVVWREKGSNSECEDWEKIRRESMGQKTIEALEKRKQFISGVAQRKFISMLKDGKIR